MQHRRGNRRTKSCIFSARRRIGTTCVIVVDSGACAFRCHRRLSPDYPDNFDRCGNRILNDPTDRILTENLCGRLLIHDPNTGYRISEGKEPSRNWTVVQNVESVGCEPVNIHLHIAKLHRWRLKFEGSPIWLIAGKSSDPCQRMEASHRLHLSLYFLEIAKISCRSRRCLYSYDNWAASCIPSVGL